MISPRWLLVPAVAALAILVAGQRAPASPAAPVPPGEYVPGEVLVKARDAAARPADTAAPIAGARVTERILALDVARVKLPPQTSVADALTVYRALSWVEFAEPNYYVRADVVPNDPFYVANQSWYYDLIQAPAAWDITTGSAAVIVAAVDTGIDLNHPDLASPGKLWTNPGEIAGNGIDDDGDTIVDDVNGAAFVSFPTASADGDCPHPAQNDPQDDNSHGTMVAGIVGADTNNGVGLGGTAWGATLMPVKVLDCSGIGVTSDIAKGIGYAAAHEADIINLSLAQCVRPLCGDGPCEQPAASATLRSAVQAAYAAGAVLIGAAGNEGCPYVAYPAAFPEVVAVGATSAPPAESSRAAFSNYGSALELVAPGESICSTIWNDSYACAGGTSFATPLVSGTAALMLSAFPGFTPENVRFFLDCGAKDLGSSGFDPEHGHGRLDAFNALSVGGRCGGTLLKGSGPEVYVLQRGLKRHIPNPVTFDAEGFRWESLQSLPDAALAAIPSGDPLLDALADGNLLTSSASPAVYVMDGGRRRHVASPAAMAACGYTFDAVRKVSRSRLDGVATGPKLSGPPCPRLSPPAGTLVKGSGGAVYVMQGGLRRHIPNPVTFAAQGFLWGNLNVIADSFLAAIPLGQPLLDSLADGNLLKGSQATRYVMEGAKKRRLVADAFNACGYGVDAVQTIPDSLLPGIATGSDLSGTPCPRLIPPTGQLVKGSDAAVYVMRQGLRRHVPNPVTFETQRFLWGNLNSIQDSVLTAVPLGEALLNSLDDGNLLKGSGDAVYVMAGGQRRHVAGLSAFTGCGYGWDAVQRIPGSLLDAIPTGPDISGPPCPWLSPPSGSLIRGTGAAVYAMEAGQRRHVASLQAFEACGFRWGNVNRIADSTLGGIPSGPDITLADC